MGSTIDSDQVYVHFLFRLNTSWSVSRARAGLPTSMNSTGRGEISHVRYILWKGHPDDMVGYCPIGPYSNVVGESACISAITLTICAF